MKTAVARKADAVAAAVAAAKERSLFANWQTERTYGKIFYTKTLIILYVNWFLEVDSVSFHNLKRRQNDSNPNP
ncbi:MAG TPA: hypothetical protein VGK56_16105, partial [Anaerolineales bacterium]